MKRDKETEKGFLERINSLLDETEEYDDWEPTDIAYDALGLLEIAKEYLDELNVEKDFLERINSLLDETEEYDDWEPTDIAYDALGLLENVKCFLEEE